MYCMKLICCVFTVNWISNLFCYYIITVNQGSILWFFFQFQRIKPSCLQIVGVQFIWKAGRSCFETSSKLNSSIFSPRWSLQVFYCYINSYFIKYWWTKLRVHAFFKEKSFLLENSYCTFFSQKNSSYP